MIIFYDPATMQVMALYSGGTTSTVWTDQGFLEAQVPLGPLEADLLNLGRDAQVTVVVGVVTSVTSALNPVLPPPDPVAIILAAHQANLAAGTINVADLIDMLRLERNP